MNFDAQEGFCHQNPDAVGCQPWTAEGSKIWHGGGYPSTDRFENLEHTPYVFAVATGRKVDVFVMFLSHLSLVDVVLLRVHLLLVAVLNWQTRWSPVGVPS